MHYVQPVSDFFFSGILVCKVSVKAKRFTENMMLSISQNEDLYFIKRSLSDGNYGASEKALA